MNAKQSIIKSSRKPKKADSKLSLQTIVLEPPAQEQKQAPTQAPTPKAKKEPKPSAAHKHFLNLFNKPIEPESQVVLLKEPPPTAELLDTYQIQAPYSQVNIYSLQELGGGKAYFINEAKLSDDEKLLLKKITEIISKEMEPPKTAKTPLITSTAKPTAS